MLIYCKNIVSVLRLLSAPHNLNYIGGDRDKSSVATNVLLHESYPCIIRRHQRCHRLALASGTLLCK